MSYRFFTILTINVVLCFTNDVTQVSQGTISFRAKTMLPATESVFVSNYEGVVNKILLHYRGGWVTCNGKGNTHWGCYSTSRGDVLMTMITLYEPSYAAGDNTTLEPLLWPNFSLPDARIITRVSQVPDELAFVIEQPPNNEINSPILEMRGPFNVRMGQAFRVSHSPAYYVSTTHDDGGSTTAEVFFEIPSPQKPSPEPTPVSSSANFIYVPEQLNFEEAESNCQYLGGHLAAPYSQSLATHLIGTPGFLQDTATDFAWIGYNNIESIDSYEWTNNAVSSDAAHVDLFDGLTFGTDSYTCALIGNDGDVEMDQCDLELSSICEITEFGVLVSQGIVSFNAATLDDDASLFNSSYTGIVTRVFLEFREGGIACEPSQPNDLSLWGCDNEDSSLLTYISYIPGGEQQEILRWPSFGAVDTRGLTESADQGSYSIANGPNSDVNGEFLELRGPVDVEEGQQFRVSYSEALLGDIAGVTTAEVFFEVNTRIFAPRGPALLPPTTDTVPQPHMTQVENVKVPTDIAVDFSWTFQGGEYALTFFTEQMSWREAEEECDAIGGHLTPIHSIEQAKELKRLSPPDSNITKVWIGAKRDAGAEAFTFSDGSPVGGYFTQKWIDEESIDDASEYCVSASLVVGADGQEAELGWTAESCDLEFPFACAPDSEHVGSAQEIFRIANDTEGNELGIGDGAQIVAAFISANHPRILSIRIDSLNSEYNADDDGCETGIIDEATVHVSVRKQNPNGRVTIEIEGGDPGECGSYVGRWVDDSERGYTSTSYENARLSVANSMVVAPGKLLSISANTMPNLIPIAGFVHEAPVYIPANFKFEFTWRPNLSDFVTAPSCSGAFHDEDCCGGDGRVCELYESQCETDNDCADDLFCGSCANLGLPWGYADPSSGCCAKHPSHLTYITSDYWTDLAENEVLIAMYGKTLDASLLSYSSDAWYYDGQWTCVGTGLTSDDCDSSKHLCGGTGLKQMSLVLEATEQQSYRHASCPSEPRLASCSDGKDSCCTVDTPCELFEGACSADTDCTGDLECSDEPCDSLGLERLDGSYRCCVQRETVREVFRFIDDETDPTPASPIISASTIYDDDPRILRIKVGDQACVTEPLEADPSTGVGVSMTVSITVQNSGSSVSIDIVGAPAGTCGSLTSLGVPTVTHPTAKLVTSNEYEGGAAKGEFTARFTSECQVDDQCPTDMLCSRESCGEMLPTSFGCCYENHCVGDPCSNSGVCVQYPSGEYTCNCSELFIGEHCEWVDPCNANPCVNGGLCVPDSTSGEYMCVCSEMFVGENCQWDNPCVEDPCFNDEECVPGSTSGEYTCNCSNLFIGEHCEWDNPCVEDPCFNDEECAPGSTSGEYTCNCSNLFIGEHCEWENPCYDNPCLNGGLCVSNSTSGEYMCVCSDMFVGEKCEWDNPCFVDPCRNDGECKWSTEEEYTCQCSGSFVGHNCQWDNLCLPNPCENGGECSNDLEFGNYYKCECPTNPLFGGTTCQFNVCPSADVDDDNDVVVSCNDTDFPDTCQLACPQGTAPRVNEITGSYGVSNVRCNNQSEWESNEGVISNFAEGVLFCEAPQCRSRTLDFEIRGLSCNFTVARTSYNITIPYGGVTNVTTVQNGTENVQQLKEGVNTVRVAAEDTIYAFDVHLLGPSTGSHLLSLEASPVGISPSFESSRYEYSIDVPRSVDEVSFAFAFAENAATRVFGHDTDADEHVEKVPTFDDQGTGQVRVSMSAESYALTIAVTAQDGVGTSEYIVELSRSGEAVEISDIVTELVTTADRWQLVLYLFAACLVVWAATSYFLKTTFDELNINDSKPFILFSSVFDVGSDVLFALVLFDEERTTLLYVGAALLGSTILVNAIAMLNAVRFEAKTNREFTAWQRGSTLPAALVVSLLSLSNCEGLMMVSVGSKKRTKVVTEGKIHYSATWFSAPVSQEFERKLRLAGLWSLLADDVGMMAMQISMLVTGFDGAVANVAVFLAVKALMLVVRTCLIVHRFMGMPKHDRSLKNLFGCGKRSPEGGISDIPDDDIAPPPTPKNPEEEVELVAATPTAESIRTSLEEIRDMIRQAADDDNSEKFVELEGLMAEHVEFVRKLINTQHHDAEKVAELVQILEEFGSGETPLHDPNSSFLGLGAEEKELEQPATRRAPEFVRAPREQERYEETHAGNAHDIDHDERGQNDEILEYLAQIRMQQYLALLRENGFRSVDDLRHTSVEDLESVGVHRDHAIVIMEAMNHTQPLRGIDNESLGEHSSRSRSGEPPIAPYNDENGGYTDPQDLSHFPQNNDDDMSGHLESLRTPRNVNYAYTRSRRSSGASHDDHRHSQNYSNDDSEPSKSRPHIDSVDDDRQAQNSREKNYFPFPRRPSVSYSRKAPTSDDHVEQSASRPHVHANERRRSVSYSRKASDSIVTTREPPALPPHVQADIRRPSASYSWRAPDNADEPSVLRTHDHADDSNSNQQAQNNTEKNYFPFPRRPSVSHSRTGDATNVETLPQRSSLPRGVTDDHIQTRRSSMSCDAAKDHTDHGQRSSTWDHTDHGGRSSLPRPRNVSDEHNSPLSRPRNISEEYASPLSATNDDYPRSELAYQSDNDYPHTHHYE